MKNQETTIAIIAVLCLLCLAALADRIPLLGVPPDPQDLAKKVAKASPADSNKQN